MKKKKYNSSIDIVGVKDSKKDCFDESKVYAKKELSNPVFKKNLQAIFKYDEILAATLWGMDENKEFDVFVGKDPIDINIINNNNLKYIYEHPVADTLKLLEDIEKSYKRYPIMYFYGLGNGVFYKALLKNQTHQKVIVIEPELEIIYIVLNLIDLSDEITSERLTLFYSKFATYTQFYYIISNEKYTSYAKIYDLHSHMPFYDKNYSEDIARINSFFTQAISYMVVAHGNSIDDTLIGIRNHIINLPAMLTNYKYHDLIKKRHKVMDTVVIVSTGPSLDKQLETLKKFAPYVSIISLDASYPILLKNGIKPDYVTSIERVEATSNFFNVNNKEFDKDIFFVVATLTHKQTIKKILPRNLVLVTRPQPSEIAFGLNQYGYLGIGHSTANQAYQLAYALAHKNIVLIGQDLAFASDGKSHASGHIYMRDNTENLQIMAYGGEGLVDTTYIWDKFRNQFENDIEQTNNKGFVTYNCTEGGARIKGSIERPFLEVMEELTKDKQVKNLPFVAKNSNKSVNADMIKAYKHILKKIEIQTKVKTRIEEVFLELVPQIDEMLEVKKNNGDVDKIFIKLSKISDKIDQLKNFISKKQFRAFLENMIQMAVYYQELELAKIAVAPSETVKEKAEKLLLWVEIHKYWMFSLAGGLNADIEVTKKASKNLVAELKKRGLINKNDIGKVKTNFKLSIE
jgi:motility accessory factor